jgi:hypothetical protein
VSYLSFVRGNDGHISFKSESSTPFKKIEDAYIVYGTRQDLSAQDPSKPKPPVDCTKSQTDAACEGDCKDNTKKTITQCACIVGDKRDACKEAGKDASESTRVLLSVVVTVLILPVFALFC